MTDSEFVVALDSVIREIDEAVQLPEASRQQQEARGHALVTCHAKLDKAAEEGIPADLEDKFKAAATKLLVHGFRVDPGDRAAQIQRHKERDQKRNQA